MENSGLTTYVSRRNYLRWSTLNILIFLKTLNYFIVEDILKLTEEI